MWKDDDGAAPLGPVGELWTIHDVAAYLRVPVATLYDWRYRGNGGPPAFKIAGTLRFDPVAVRQWLAQECREERSA
jgi:hypothetical protein